MNVRTNVVDNHVRLPLSYTVRNITTAINAATDVAVTDRAVWPVLYTATPGDNENSIHFWSSGIAAVLAAGMHNSYGCAVASPSTEYGCVHSVNGSLHVGMVSGTVPTLRVVPFFAVANSATLSASTAAPVNECDVWVALPLTSAIHLTSTTDLLDRVIHYTVNCSVWTPDGNTSGFPYIAGWRVENLTATANNAIWLGDMSIRSYSTNYPVVVPDRNG